MNAKRAPSGDYVLSFCVRELLRLKHTLFSSVS